MLCCARPFLSLGMATRVGMLVVAEQFSNGLAQSFCLAVIKSRFKKVLSSGTEHACPQSCHPLYSPHSPRMSLIPRCLDKHPYLDLVMEVRYASGHIAS